MSILETERLVLREMEAARDAAFICELLNSPKFIKYIGDRGVRSADDASDLIEDRYRQSYRDHGYGLYAVELKTENTSIGICGYVKRDTLPLPDIGFAFLPKFERKGYAFEAASATLQFGRDVLGMTNILAIVSPSNAASAALLRKLGFRPDRQIDSGGEVVDLYDLKFESK
ncbi:MAG: GNAT family N-acetyltransferase [Acidobacteriota bacterium]